MTTQPAAEAAGVVDVVPTGMDEDLVRVGRMFLRLARGAAGATLPVEPQVTVLLGGEQATVLTSTQADDRASWEQLCDSSGKGYAERSCPVSALAALADSEGVTFSTEPAQEPCSGPHGLEPGDVGGTKRVTLLARPHGSCLDYAAVELYLNDVSQLVAANLVLGSP
jgi:hypothetical protein